MNKQEWADKLTEISESATALADAADEAVGAFEAEPGEYSKEDRDDLLETAETSFRELLVAVPASWKK